MQESSEEIAFYLSPIFQPKLMCQLKSCRDKQLLYRIYIYLKRVFSALETMRWCFSALQYLIALICSIYNRKDAKLLKAWELSYKIWVCAPVIHKMHLFGFQLAFELEEIHIFAFQAAYMLGCSCHFLIHRLFRYWDMLFNWAVKHPYIWGNQINNVSFVQNKSVKMLNSWNLEFNYHVIYNKFSIHWIKQDYWSDHSYSAEYWIFSPISSPFLDFMTITFSISRMSSSWQYLYFKGLKWLLHFFLTVKMVVAVHAYV